MMRGERYRKAIFAVAYTISENGVEYILLKRKKHWKGWEFPKGKIERFELKKKTAKRELFEETGLKAVSVKRFRQINGKYLYDHELKDRPGVVGQTFHLFAIEVEKPLDGKIKIDPKEHYKGEWLSFKDAYKKLTWDDQKRCLKIVDEWIKYKYANRKSFFKKIFG